jgi:hypothetical protein
MNRFATGLVALVLALVAPAVPRAADAAAEPIESVLVLAVEGDVFINADGSLADYRIDTPAPGNTAENVLRIARGWRFEPVLVEGKPQAVVARMRVALAATKQGEQFQVRVDNVTFPGLAAAARERARDEGVRLEKNPRPPRYPPGVQRAGIAGRVLLALRYDESGKVTDVAAVQSMLFDRRESDEVTARAIELLEQAAVEAAHDWRIHKPVEGKPRIAMTAVEFLANYHDKRNSDGTLEAGGWRLVSRTPKRYVEWLDSKRNGTPSVSDIGSGDLVPVADATLKLSTPVVGTLL